MNWANMQNSPIEAFLEESEKERDGIMERLGNGVPAAPAEAKTRLWCKTMRSTTMWCVVK